MVAEAPEGWAPATEVHVGRARKLVLEAFDRAPLECYYDVEGNFGGATFVGLEPNDPFDITAADLHAVSMLAVNIEPAATRRLLNDTEQRAHLLDALEAVPPGLALADASNEDLTLAWALHEATLGALAAPRAKKSHPWVTAAKLTARKRPLLIPVRDNLVAGALGPEVLEDGGLYWQIMRQLVSETMILDAAAAAVALARDRAAAAGRRVVFETNILRLIDAALWMTSAGYRRSASGECPKPDRSKAKFAADVESEDE